MNLEFFLLIVRFVRFVVALPIFALAIILMTLWEIVSGDKFKVPSK